ncbi:hypothetical protein KIN20_002668 [Parelaphostrongylus tenuis]|uniref:Uncharacterized protein n=1 Tax=Parelaphostrongylus tenuis TaxID=148309 RepID=A0AAD5QFI8_PARTN|nr:hypothetical protein KIN20_002668 [Parelaphostrongylus tenuis]
MHHQLESKSDPLQLFNDGHPINFAWMSGVQLALQTGAVGVKLSKEHAIRLDTNP